MGTTLTKELSIINIEDNEIWDRTVKSFENYDVNYLNEYVKAFQLNGEGEPILFYYSDSNTNTRAINVFMKRDIANTNYFSDRLPKNTWFDISTPYGYGGFLIEGENYQAVNAAFDNYCINEGYISEFVRFHLINNYQEYYNGVKETYIRNVVRNLENPIEDMFMDFEHRVRKSIKKAMKAELEVVIDTSGERLNDFIEIYYKTMKRSNAKEAYYFSEGFFKTLNNMNDNYVYIHVLYEGKVISTELVLYGSENCYSFLGGTDEEYFHLNVNNLLKYEIIKWAKNKGLKRFILGGGYGADDGIFNYKKGFAPNGIFDFYIGKKIFNKEKYNYLVQLRNMDKNFDEKSKFFPLYRA
ncbi:hypothetical protein UACE39S_01444 [Ureibacillus acetophenoni]